MITTLLFVLAFVSGLTKGQEISGIQNRGQELTCYECASKTGNDTCTDAFRKTIKTFGFDKRCRIMEMNGKVVSQGVVPKAVCTPRALSNVNKMKKHLHLRGLGDIYPYCCNFDLCNVDMCTSMGLQKGHSLCTTTIEHKLKELQHKPNLADVEIIAPIANSNSNKENFGEDPQKPLASLQAGIGGTGLTQKSGASGQKCIPWIVIGFFAIVIIQ